MQKLEDAEFFASAREGMSFGLMMNMLLEGTKGSSKKATVDFFEQRGASFDFGIKGAVLSCLTADFAVLLDRFVQVLTQPTFAKDALEKLKKIDIDSLQRSKDDAKDTAGRLLKNALYKDQAYAWTFDDAISDVASCTAASLRALHAQYVTAENMVVSVAGSFDVDEMEHLVRCYFGKLETGVRLPAPRLEYKQTVAENIDCTMTRDQVVVMYGKQSPVKVYDPDYVPLRILNYICFNSIGSRLYKIREQTGLFYYCFGEFAARARKNAGYDYAGAIVNPENVALAEVEIYKCFAELAANGVTLRELDAAKNSYEKDLIDLVANNDQIGRLVGSVHMLDLDANYYDKVLQRVHALTLDEVNALVARYVQTDNFIRVRVGRV